VLATTDQPLLSPAHTIAIIMLTLQFMKLKKGGKQKKIKAVFFLCLPGLLFAAADAKK
jgi:hypothetical protein